MEKEAVNSKKSGEGLTGSVQKEEKEWVSVVILL